MLRLIHSHIFPAENSWPISYCKHFTSKTLSSSGQRGHDSQPFLFPFQGAFSEKPGGLNLKASVAKDKWVFHSSKTPLVGINCTLNSQEEKQYYTVIQNRDSSQTAWVQILALPFIMCVNLSNIYSTASSFIFLIWKNEANHFKGLWWELNEIIHIKGLLAESLSLYTYINITVCCPLRWSIT